MYPVIPAELTQNAIQLVVCFVADSRDHVRILSLV